MVELMREVLHEIVAKPLTFGAEVIQFVALVAIVKAVAFGFGSKGGMVTNMLTERRARIDRQLRDAEAVDAELAAAKKQARAIVRVARAQATETVEAAKRAAQDELSRARGALEEEAGGVRGQAQELVDKERTEAFAGMDEQLVSVVTGATRQILNEGFSPAQQRALIQKAVLDGLDDLESVALS